VGRGSSAKFAIGGARIAAAVQEAKCSNLKMAMQATNPAFGSLLVMEGVEFCSGLNGRPQSKGWDYSRAPASHSRPQWKTIWRRSDCEHAYLDDLNHDNLTIIRVQERHFGHG
jgi:hypothetical protein